MFNDIHSIIVGLISNIVWLPIGALLVALGYFVRVRFPRRRLWRLTNPSCLTVCAATSTITDTGSYYRPATGIGQVRALAVAIKSLGKTYNHQLDIKNILLSKESLQERTENDMLLLGGPKNNEVTAYFLNLMRDKQPVVQLINPSTIIWRERTPKGKWTNAGAVGYDSQISRNRVIQDYGLIMRVESPFVAGGRTVILFSGIHTYGLVAAAKYFTEDMLKGFSWTKRLKNKNIVALVRTQVLDGYPTKIKLERVYTW